MPTISTFSKLDFVFVDGFILVFTYGDIPDWTFIY